MPSTLRNLALFVLVPLVLLYLGAQAIQDRPAVLSRWGVGPAGEAQPGGLSGAAAAVAGGAAPIELLTTFNAGSALQESVADGNVAFYRRAMPGGELAYVVVQLGERSHVELITADGATPGSDAAGDTIWTDGQKHLARVADMVRAPYARRDGLELLAAIAFGFHGAERTSNEGSVVINSQVLRVNAGRAALCITPDDSARIGLFDATALAGCAQAVGAGPVILWQGRVASPAVSAPTDELIPFNPLSEDFVQLDWRIKIYNGTYPKTAVGVGDRPDGRSFLVLALSRGITGVDLAGALRAMGCRDALGGDDDTSTQGTWRGASFWDTTVRAVPDAIGVYVR